MAKNLGYIAIGLIVTFVVTWPLSLLGQQVAPIVSLDYGESEYLWNAFIGLMTLVFTMFMVYVMWGLGKFIDELFSEPKSKSRKK